MRLLVLLGPIAVGKTTVAYEISERTGFPVFHNHMTVEPLAHIFGFGTPSYERLTVAWRTSVIAEAVTSALPGLVLTTAIDFGDPADIAYLEALVAPVVPGGGRVDWVELTADQRTRLSREGTEPRVSHKPSKRDVDGARSLLRRLDERAQFTSRGRFPLPGDHRRIDTTERPPATTAELIIDAFDLPHRLHR